MAFTDHDIIQYFGDLFVSIGIPQNNVHLSCAFRDKPLSNLPSVEIYRNKGKVDTEDCGIRESARNQGKLLRIFKRRIQITINVRTNLQETGNPYPLGKITSLFYRELNQPYADIGTNAPMDSPVDQKRLVRFTDLQESYPRVVDYNGRPVDIANLLITCEYYEYNSLID